MSSPLDVGLVWNTFVQQIANLGVYQTTTVGGVVQGVDDTFNTLMPQCCNYAELRIQRDLDLLPSQQTKTYTMTSGTSTLTIPIDDFVTVQTINLTGVASLPLLPVSKEYIQNLYGFGTTNGPPTVFAMLGGDSSGGNTSNILLLGPTPDQNYATSIVGTARLPSLYLNASDPLASTANTFISAYLPDLMIQAAMIYVSEFQRHFGATANDPQMPGTYESNYQALLRGAMVEESRKKFSASGWSSMSPPVVASADR